MLKIYLKTIHHEIHSDGVEYEVHHNSFCIIEEETCAQPYTRECSLYHDELHQIVSYCDYFDRRRGRAVLVCGDDCYLTFKQWKEPNAKLIERVSYREYACSMRELCRLPADKVIAYLKQEGLSFHLTN
jgi:hypothetical protein